jgi:hypothetical protein
MEPSVGSLYMSSHFCVEKAWCVHLPILIRMFDKMLEIIYVLSSI